MLMHILIAVDRLEQANKLARLLERKDTMVEAVPEPRAFWKVVGRRTSDLLIVDRHLVSDRALREIQILRETASAPALVILSEEKDDADRADLIAIGCQAVLSPRLSARRLGAALGAILDRRREATATIVSVPSKPTHTEITDFVAKSPAMQTFLKALPRIARSASSVLILGETGVGKERLAHVLHSEGRRPKGPFVAVHCGALPESLLESELFGHEQGAFTGATRSRRGCFELAHQGTIFLDEIGEMPLHLQSKLLRVLEDHTIRRVGSEQSIIVDVRVIAATNRDLDEEARNKQFRRDLYYRLNVVSLTIPPLRARPEDIPELVGSYIEYLGPRIGCEVSGISPEAMEALREYSWPGNVRELINVIERALLLCEGDEITCHDLPGAIAGARYHQRPSATFSGGSLRPQGAQDEWLQLPLKEARTTLLKDFEKWYVHNVLTEAKGRVGEAARRAGIDPRTIFAKMKQYGLDKRDFHS
jgi:DNA-binding NtrC family response regulator